MNSSSTMRAALIGLIAAFTLAAAPAQAAKVYFGTQEYLRKIQDVDITGPKGEALYLGYKYSHHSFVLPYRTTDDGYILGVRGQQSYFRLDDANIKSFQARGLLPSPLPSYELSFTDYVMGYLLWLVLAVIAGLLVVPVFAKRRRQRALPHLNEGIERHRIGDLDGAIESYTRAVEADSKLAVAFNLRGKAIAAKGDAIGSISDQTKAIRIEPKFAEALMDRGILMRTTGNPVGAISDFSRVIKLNNDTRAYFQRGLTYLDQGDFRRAIPDFTRVIAEVPEFPDSYQQRAIAYSKLGDGRRAQEDQERARELVHAQPAA